MNSGAYAMNPNRLPAFTCGEMYHNKALYYLRHHMVARQIMIQSCRLTCLFYSGLHSCSILQDPCSVLLMEADSPSRHTADVSNVSITSSSLQYTFIYRAVSCTAVLPRRLSVPHMAYATIAPPNNL